MKVYKTVKIDITEEFKQVIDDYKKRKIETLADCADKLGMKLHQFNKYYSKYKNILKIERVPKPTRWLNEDGTLSEWAKNIYKEYFEQKDLPLNRILKKYDATYNMFIKYMNLYER